MIDYNHLHHSFCFSPFADPLMRWNGWKKCHICFSALELNATLQNQNHREKGMKIPGAKSNHGRWWWIRNTLSSGGAQLQAPTFTSIEVSPAWLPCRCVPWLARCTGLLFFILSNCSGCCSENLPWFPVLCFPSPRWQASQCLHYCTLL